jgi:hypothetical protein
VNIRKSYYTKVEPTYGMTLISIESFQTDSLESLSL